MVKRRNSPYASHQRAAPKNVKVNFSPQLLEPLPVTERKMYGKFG